MVVRYELHISTVGAVGRDCCGHHRVGFICGGSEMSNAKQAFLKSILKPGEHYAGIIFGKDMDGRKSMGCKSWWRASVKARAVSTMITPRRTLTSLIDRMLTRLFGHKCEKCSSRNTQHANRWARGWNHRCDQAYGDWGAFCNTCHYITWDKPIEEHIATLPSWCKPYQN